MDGRTALLRCNQSTSLLGTCQTFSYRLTAPVHRASKVRFAWWCVRGRDDDPANDNKSGHFLRQTPQPARAVQIYLGVETSGPDEMSVADNQRTTDPPHTRST